MNMHLPDFLAKVSDAIWFDDQYTVVWFVSPGEYPIYFFSCLCKKLKEKNTQTLFSTVRLDECDLATLQAMTGSSFLGNCTTFWLGNSDLLSAKIRASFLSHLLEYDGPNQCMLYASENPAVERKNHLVVQCGEYVDKALFEVLLHFMYGGLTERDRFFASRLYGVKRKISLDSACLLTHYARLCAHDYERFSKDILNQIVVPEGSLFTLAQYFFACNRKAFLAEWHSLYPLYPDLFWVSFWADQIWRAYHYVRLSKASQQAEAKYFSRKLPFSFINYDWKKAKLDELSEMLDFIYDLDTRLKNGMSGYGAFELLFLDYFKKN